MHAERTRPERKFALSKIAAGDYLLPSNDGQTIWRIFKYEDGPSHGLADWDRDRGFWALWRWAEPFTGAKRGYVDTQDWSRWEHCSDMHATRADAISDAMRMEQRASD